MKWHYICKEVELFNKKDDDDRDGIYLVYLTDEYDKILNGDKTEERQYLSMRRKSSIPSNNGDLMYVPFKLRSEFENTHEIFTECYSF